MKKAGSLLAFFVLSFAVAAVASRFRPDAWYETIARPSWNPPNWVFPVVWPVLYVLIAVSGWLVWQARDRGCVRSAFIIYGLQLILNAAWMWIFFELHALHLATMEIALLAATIAVNVVLFWRIRPLAGILLLPYLAWVAFAAVLTATIWRLNGA